MPVDFVAVEPDSIQVVSKRADLADRCFIIRINDSFKKRQGFIELIRSCGSGHTMAAYTKRRFQRRVFIKGIVPLIILFFFVVSLAYGIATRTIRRQADLPHLMIEPMKEMAGFIVMVFPLAQFVAMFNWSNMGKFIAVGLTDILESSGLSGIPAFVGLALLSSFLCMFIASGSAIWSILAPIFVPMFMLLGFHPAFAQILFRIADSSVLPLAPVSPFVPLFLGFLQRYKPDAKLGTYYSLVLPYPLIF